MTDIKDNILKELQAIEKRDGILKPEKVVQFAKSPKTALHSQFEWDDTEAAYEYRLWQARHLIRTVSVVVEHENQSVETKAFVHIKTDEVDRGYRSISVVLKNQDMRANMLETALRELRYFRRKYANLKELTAVFDMIDSIE